MNFGGDRDDQTICAVSTPAGYGGISVIRISGSKALNSISKYCKSIDINNFLSHTVKLSTFRNPEGTGIDDVVVTYFKGPHSFTGEDVIEISCHGNPLIAEQIINNLVDCGCSIALPGEFTYRAFINNRIDLIQAESVLDLIEANSVNASQLALRQLKGKLSEDFQYLEDELTWVLAHIEASIDFSTEGIDVISDEVAMKKLESIKLKIVQLIETYKSGKFLRDGVKIVFFGSPNVGKSSILNSLIGEEKAIVTSIPGTTRDIIEGHLNYKGQKFLFVDTAGIRESDDIVESIGIKKSLNELMNSDLNVLVLDASVGFDSYTNEILQKVDLNKTIFLLNKVDLISKYDEKSPFFGANMGQKPPFFDANSVVFLPFSTLNFQFSSEFLEFLNSKFTNRFSAETVSVINSRHYQNLSLSLEKINKSIDTLSLKLGSEFVSLDLRDSLNSVLQVLGKSYDDQILDKVFKEFCIGK